MLKKVRIAFKEAQEFMEEVAIGRSMVYFGKDFDKEEYK